MSSGIGFLAAAGSVLGFGTNFVPVKRVYAGDGMFFQWIMSLVVYMTGIILYFILGRPQFEPFAMLGGFIWTMGNCLSVPIIRLIGVGMAILLWGCSSLIVGWCTGAFGLFGLNKDPRVHIVWLNYTGAVICLFSLFIYFFVETNETPMEDNSKNMSTSPLLMTASGSECDDDDINRRNNMGKQTEHTPLNNNNNDDDDDISTWSPLPHTPLHMRIVRSKLRPHTEPDFAALDRLSPASQRMLGCIGAVVAGVFFGTNFNPPQYLIDHPNERILGVTNHSTHGWDYIFSHYTGIAIGSTFYFLLYIVMKGGRPSIYPSIVMPGICSGILWSIAQMCWFVANEKLSFVVSFPIITTLPGVVSSLIGILAFNEIKGKRNFITITIAFLTTATGVAFIVISKVG